MQILATEGVEGKPWSQYTKRHSLNSLKKKNIRRTNRKAENGLTQKKKIKQNLTYISFYQVGMIKVKIRPENY